MRFEKYIQSLIDREIIPGASILIGRGDQIIFKRQYGLKARIPEEQPLGENVIYDVASLTKPLVTALLVLYLHQREGRGLKADIGTFFPEIKGGVTIQQLLSHTAGLPAWYPFYLFEPTYLEQIKSLELQNKPGRRVVYSCPGYILLHYLIEKVTSMSFVEIARNLLFKPLGLKRAGFCLSEELKIHTAPTEEGNRFEREMALKLFSDKASGFKWRQHMICGDTHDANSHYLGGTAGNSGLFACAEDLFVLSREFFPESATLLKAEFVQRFWRNETPGKRSHRSLGFKLNSSFITSGGRAIDRHAIGHSGFTGTSIWLEPYPGYTFIILTNRIHPKVGSINFNRVRRRLHRYLVIDLQLRSR